MRKKKTKYNSNQCEKHILIAANSMTMDPLMSSEVHLYCVESLASNLPLITKFPELVNCPLGILGVQV